MYHKVLFFVRSNGGPVQLMRATLALGPLQLLRKLPGLYFDRRYDRTFNVDTWGSIHLRELDIDSENVGQGTIYDPLPQKSAQSVLSNVPDDVRDYTFVDFGSGKGRVLLIASEYPYKKIVGVEFAHVLHEAARTNVANYRNPAQRCYDIEPILMDALLFPIPDGKCVFHFFAPFGRGVLEPVLARIKEAYVAAPRHMILLYVTDPNTYPMPIDLFESAGFLHQVSAKALPFDLARRYPLAVWMFETRS